MTTTSLNEYSIVCPVTGLSGVMLQRGYIHMTYYSRTEIRDSKALMAYMIRQLLYFTHDDYFMFAEERTWPVPVPTTLNG